jgi:Uma2 family endonuclease
VRLETRHVGAHPGFTSDGDTTMAITNQEMTLEQFLELPEEKPALEFDHGRITQKVPPMGKHSALQMEIGGLVNNLARKSKLAMAFSELRVTLDGVSRVPDVSVYVWDRIPRDPSGEVANDFMTVPDIVIEIVSPQQSANSLIRRCLWFTERGTRAALLIDPLDKSVISFRPGQPMKGLHGDDLVALTDIVPGLQLTVDDLFQLLLV